MGSQRDFFGFLPALERGYDPARQCGHGRSIVAGLRCHAAPTVWFRNDWPCMGPVAKNEFEGRCEKHAADGRREDRPWVEIPCPDCGEVIERAH